ncbi:MMPL family transporter [Actinoplanes sp. DH11]|uniref:MMPL family transporter n=1 Tax=Actinoplanes sp. DH11 TaxID=2857011 RepID=UPI001E477FDE|nr:MMPL family transporter [Actinoplanes sp. DH11]
MLIVALVAVLGSGIWGFGVFDRLTEGGYTDPSSESARSADVVATALGGQSGDVIAIWTPDRGTIDDAALTKRIKERLAALPATAVIGKNSYWDKKAPRFAAEDKSSAAAVLTLAGDDDAAKMDAYGEIEDDLGVPGAHLQLAGGVPLSHASSARSSEDLVFAEMISLPIVLVLLLFIFGSLVAASLPVLVGGAAVLGSLGVLNTVALTHEVNSFAVNVASLLGLGMAIDYGLFMVGRFREEQAAHPTAEAVRRTVATAGRTVLFSATLLMTALAGLLLFPQGFLKSLAYGGLAAVFLAMLLSLTLLPAILAILGPRVDKLPVRLPGRSGTGHGWARLAGTVLRRPLLFAVPILAGLVVLALPIAGVRFGENDERVLPAGDPSRVAIETLKSDYPQFSTGGVQIVVRGSTDVKEFGEAAGKVPGVAGVTTTGATDDLVVLNAALTAADPFGSDARQVVEDLRALPAPAGAEVLVGGATARNVDSIAAIGDRLPLMIGLLAGATLILMFLAFGSILLPIKAVVMSGLSLTATFGILVWIFQEGHGAGLLDVTPAPLEAGIVVLMGAVVFGLSTDYEVFLLSRMVEARVKGASSTEAVTIGLTRTGRVISAAALLLIMVTGAFALSSVTTMRFVGVGMIIALVLDATVVRMLLVPAVLALFGDAAWWAPGPLRRLQERAGLAEHAGEADLDGKHAARPGEPSFAEAAGLDTVVLHRRPAHALQGANRPALTGPAHENNTVVLDYADVLDYLAEKERVSATTSAGTPMAALPAAPTDDTTVLPVINVDGASHTPPPGAEATSPDPRAHADGASPNPRAHAEPAPSPTGTGTGTGTGTDQASSLAPRASAGSPADIPSPPPIAPTPPADIPDLSPITSASPAFADPVAGARSSDDPATSAAEEPPIFAEARTATEPPPVDSEAIWAEVEATLAAGAEVSQVIKLPTPPGHEDHPTQLLRTISATNHADSPAPNEPATRDVRAPHDERTADGGPATRDARAPHDEQAAHGEPATDNESAAQDEPVGTDLGAPTSAFASSGDHSAGELGTTVTDSDSRPEIRELSRPVSGLPVNLGTEEDAHAEGGDAAARESATKDSSTEESTPATASAAQSVAPTDLAGFPERDHTDRAASDRIPAAGSATPGPVEEAVRPEQVAPAAEHVSAEHVSAVEEAAPTLERAVPAPEVTSPDQERGAHEADGERAVAEAPAPAAGNAVSASDSAFIPQPEDAAAQDTAPEQHPVPSAASIDPASPAAEQPTAESIATSAVTTATPDEAAADEDAEGRVVTGQTTSVQSPSDETEPDQAAPSQGEPSQDAPDQDVPNQDALGQDAPDRDTPGRDAPDRDAPGRDALSQDSLSQGAQGQSTPDRVGSGREASDLGAHREGRPDSTVRVAETELPPAAETEHASLPDGSAQPDEPSDAGDAARPAHTAADEREAGDNTGSDEVPGAEKPGEGRPAEGRPAEGRPGEGRPGEGRPGEGASGEPRGAAGGEAGGNEAPVADPFAWRNDPRLAILTAPGADSFGWLSRGGEKPDTPAEPERADSAGAGEQVSAPAPERTGEERTPGDGTPGTRRPRTLGDLLGGGTPVPVPVPSPPAPSRRPQTLDEWLSTSRPKSGGNGTTRPAKADAMASADEAANPADEAANPAHAARPRTLDDWLSGPKPPAGRPTSLADQQHITAPKPAGADQEKKQ